MEDIRKTGPIGLKGINTQTQEEVEPIDLGSTFDWGIARIPDSYGIGKDIPIYSSTGDLGTSSYDKLGGLTAEDISDVENMRAEKQSTLSKWVNGITKGGVLAGTTFLDGTVGLAFGLVDVLSNLGNKEESGWETFSRLWDNEFSNGLQQINQMSENWLPNYKTAEERDRAWYQNLGTANFWADTFLKNMGFTVGAFASGSAFNKVLKSAKLIHTGLGAATAGSVYGAINEARIEANNNSNDFYKLEQQKIQDSYKEEYDVIWSNGLLNLEEKNQRIKELNNKYQAIQEDLDVRKSKMGLGTFIGNSVFLSLNDFFTMGRLYAKGFQNARKTGKKLSATADDLFAADQSIGKHVTKQGETWVAENISTGKALQKGATKAVLEGHEELAQKFISGTFGELYNTDSPDAYFNASLDSDAIVETDSFLNAAIKGFKDSYGNMDSYEEFAVGFLTGALGIPTFGRVNNSDASTVLGRSKSVGLTGGILGELSMAKSANKEMNEAVAFMNKYEQKLKTNKEHFVRSQSFTNAMSGWSEANNAFEYKNAEDNDDFVAISRYAAMGKLDHLKSLVNQDFENISDETLQAMARETSTNTSGWYNVDGTYTPDGEAGAAEMRKELIKKRDQILTQINNYETAVRETQSIANDSLSKDQIEELAWLHWKGSRFKERYAQMKETFPTFYQAITENLGNWEKALESLEDSEIDSKAKEDLKKTINNFKLFIDTINSSKDLMFISSFLDKNKGFLEFINSKDFYDAFGEHTTLGHADYQKVVDNLRDIGKIANAYKSFNDRYKEFVKNPTKIEKNRAKIKAKKEAVQRSIDKNETVSKVESISKNELLNKIQDGEIDLEELKDFVGLNDVDIEESLDTEAAKKVKDVEKMITLIEEGKTEAMRMFQNGELDEQEFQDAVTLIESSGRSAEDVDQVFNMDLESALNPDILPNTEGESLLPDIEKAIAKEERLDTARSKVNFIRSKITSRDKGITEQPTPSTTAEETGHDKSTRTETIQETKAKKELESNRNKDLKELLLKADAFIEAVDKIPVRDAIIRMYDSAKTLFNNGLSSDEILETLHKFPQYETLKKYPKVLQLIKDYVESLYASKPTKVVSEITLDDVSEQEVIVSPNEDVENQNKEIKNQISNEDSTNYWQPSTSQFPIYRQDGSRIPFYKIASSLKKEDGTPRYTEAQIKRMEAVYKYLESKGTFSIRNSQSLSVKDAVHFIIDPTLNQEAGDVVILMTDSKGNVIGDLVDTSHESAAKHKGLIEVSNTIKQEYEDWVNAGNTGLFTSQKYKSKIAQLMVGKVEYSDERHSLNEIFTITTSSGATKQLPYKIAVVVADKAGNFKLTTTSESGGKKGIDPIGDSAIKPLKAKKGQPFILIPTNNPKRAYMPVSFAMPRYDRGTAKSTLGTIIDDILEDIKTINSAQDCTKLANRLAEHLGNAWRGDDGKLKTSFHINRTSKYVETATNTELQSGISFKEQRTLIKISYVPEKSKSALFTIELDPNDPEAINKLKNEMFKHQIPFRINRKYLNKKIGNLDYNSVIGELANTNVEPGYVTTTNNWFTIAPISIDGTVQKTDVIKTTGINPTAATSKPTTVTKTAIEYGGKTFFVDEQWNVTDETGKAYNKGENTLKFLGYAWGIIKDEDMTKPYNTEWGMYDPVKKNYMPKTEEQGPTLLYGKPAQEALPPHNSATGEVYENDLMSEIKTKPELIAELKSKGLLNTPKRQKMVEFLSESQLQTIINANPMIARQVVQKLEQSFDNKTGQFKNNPSDIIGVDRNREAVEDYKVFDRDKELKWLEFALPQFKDRVQLVEGLIKIVNGINSDRAFGKFVNGHIILSDKAAEGTVYHEAFHAVVNTLLNESELLDVLEEGKKQFGVTSDVAAEEKLAEGFRKYIQTEQGFGGSIVKAFRKIKHYIQSIRGNESIINKLYYDISQGYYADRKIAETEVSRNREVDLTNYSLEELLELKNFLSSKQFQVKHDNATKLVDYVMSNPMLKKAYELGLLKDVKHRGEKDTCRIVPKTTELNKLIRSKRKGETSHIVEVVSEREYSVYRPNLTREQRISEAALAWQERDVDTFDEINEYHEYKSNYDYLSLEDKQYVNSIGMSKEQWDKLQNKVKEAILHCK